MVFWVLVLRPLGFGKVPPGIQEIEIFSEEVGSSVPVDVLIVPLHEVEPVEIVDPLEVGTDPHVTIAAIRFTSFPIATKKQKRVE